MQLGLVTDSLGRLPLDAVLDIAAELGLDSVELATGNWSEAPHAVVAALATSADARRRLADAVAARGLTISALNANGNQLHPVDGTAHDLVVRQTVVAAAELGVPTVVLMSGLPAAPGDRTPNWITTSWPPETVRVLEHQWTAVALPYWHDLAAFAEQRGVRLAVELHGNQLVHNVATLLRLRDAVGPVVGANLDPSHLLWMGADPLAAARALDGAIHHVHAKDTRIEAATAAVHGLLDTQPPAAARTRSWNYVTIGLGHGAAFWAEFAYALRQSGYDGAVNIEHEDVAVGAEEGVRRSVRILRDAVLRDAPDWTPAAV